MIPEDDPIRCSTCHGIHPGHACPIELAKNPRQPITEAQDAAARAFLKRAARRGRQ